MTRGAALARLAAGAMLLIGAGVGEAAVSTGTGGHGVTVGNSALIGTLDYSDTFTFGPTATVVGRQTYTSGAASKSLDIRQMESSYGNPTVDWSYSTTKNFADFGSIANDGALSDGIPAYPGSSGAGSATGFSQAGYNSSYDFTTPYGLRTDFIVQFDTLLTTDRVDVGVNSAAYLNAAAISASNTQGLMVFFRTDENVRNSLAVYYRGVEYDTGLDTGLSSADVGKWQNFAVRFDLDAKELTFWVNENLLGTWSWGSLSAFATADISNAFVGIGAAAGNRLWTDNFQVGAVVAAPEPSTFAGVALLMGAGLIRRRR